MQLSAITTLNKAQFLLHIELLKTRKLSLVFKKRAYICDLPFYFARIAKYTCDPVNSTPGLSPSIWAHDFLALLLRIFSLDAGTNAAERMENGKMTQQVMSHSAISDKY